MQDFTTFVCYRLKSTMKKLEKYIGQVMDEYGLTLAQSFILFSLLEKDGCALTEIGNRAQIDNSSLTTMVDKLEKEGLVERRLFAADRRVVTLFLTDSGRELACKVFNTGFDFNNILVGKLNGIQGNFLTALDIISDTVDSEKSCS